MASHQILDAFQTLVSIDTFTPEFVAKITKFVINYELRGTNIQAFNTFTLGVHKCFFGDTDRDNFFSLFNINVNEIRKLTNKITTIDPKFRVVSDPFNLFISYVLHCIVASPHLPAWDINNIRSDGLKVMMLIQYKFFTSLVNHYFPHAPNEGTMRAAYETMSNKFEIKMYGTWAKVLEERAKQFLGPNSIHINTLKQFDNDKNILYFISDLQTRVRTQVSAFTATFYETKDKQDTISMYTSLGSDNEGEKVLMDSNTPIESAIMNIFTDCMNVNTFIDLRLINVATSQFTNINATSFKAFLITFSEYATVMYRKNKSKETMVIDSCTIITGPELFLQTLLRQCYRVCANNHVDLNRPLLILKTVKDVFSSSRISDEDILQLRKTLEYFVLKLQANRRDIIMSGLRICFVLYIVLLSFRYTGILGK